jgi:hypothetical protein
MGWLLAAGIIDGIIHWLPAGPARRPASRPMHLGSLGVNLCMNPDELNI